jgi:signal transduction histidine kinase
MDAYREQQLRLLETIAGQAAIAVRNAKLFESETRAKNERDEFLSLVTHEIKNPLTSIRGYAAIVRESAGRGDVAPIGEAVRVIEAESAKILRLTEDLLDASRMSAGRFSVRLEKVDLASIARQVVQKYEATSSHKFDCHLPASTAPLKGDPIRLSQVVENLVSNAVKYSPPGSTVHLAMRWEARTVFLSIRDEGGGIPPERLSFLFERFYRVEEEGSLVKGTGLGLFISREIIRMHGGNISVESNVGQGSKFTVELPLEA